MRREIVLEEADWAARQSVGYTGAMGYSMPRSNERKAQLEAELGRIVDVLIEQGASKIVLFGSLARGNVRSYSDIDLIVVKETNKRFLDRLDDAYRAIAPGVGLDLLIYTPEEFETLKEKNPFVRNALAEGKMLYGEERR